MGELSIWHWLVVLIVVLLLFGSGKVSGMMGDFAKGIKAFKKNMAEDDQPPAKATAKAAEPLEIAKAAPAATAPAQEKAPAQHQA